MQVGDGLKDGLFSGREREREREKREREREREKREREREERERERDGWMDGRKEGRRWVGGKTMVGRREIQALTCRSN